jgi:predicted RNase H-like nuclease (RuvC/YqgF family)
LSNYDVDDAATDFDEPMTNFEVYTTTEVEKEVVSDPVPTSPKLKQASKVKKLKEELKELEFLDKHIKVENETLKTNISKLQKENEQLEAEKKLLVKKARKWYIHSMQVKIKNKRLKIKLNEEKRKIHASSFGLNILIDATERV